MPRRNRSEISAGIAVSEQLRVPVFPRENGSLKNAIACWTIRINDPLVELNVGAESERDRAACIYINSNRKFDSQGVRHRRTDLTRLPFRPFLSRSSATADGSPCLFPIRKSIDSERAVDDPLIYASRQWLSIGLWTIDVQRLPLAVQLLDNPAASNRYIFKLIDRFIRELHYSQLIRRLERFD